MKRSILCAASLVALAGPLAAQATQPASNTTTANPAVSASRMTWQILTGYFTRAAEQMPESEYGFRPVDSVRTFGQVVGHVAGAQHMFCAAALGETAPAEDAVERTATTKAQLIQALRESTEHCERAYAQSDADAAAMTTLFGSQRSRMFALSLNAAHNGEHYGNLVTYLRVKGMVPPSSQPSN
jgi:uncharacterized damage-inducible protein DinB